MEAVSCVRVLPVFLIFVFHVMAVAPQSALGANEPAALVSVEYIGVNPAIESINAETTFIFGDAKRSLSSIKLGGDPAHENAFLLRPKTALTLEFLTVGDFSPQGVPLPGESLAKLALNKGDVYLFRHHVPEGMPNLIVCAARDQERRCWIPRFSGVDGSAELDPGFIVFKKD